MKRIFIILIALMVSGCYEHKPRRFVCDDFTTPWSWMATRDMDVITWKVQQFEYYSSYVIPPGHICAFEMRKQ